MKKLKEMWGTKYPEHKNLAANTLSDNARRSTSMRAVLPTSKNLKTSGQTSGKQKKKLTKKPVG